MIFIFELNLINVDLHLILFSLIRWNDDNDEKRLEETIDVNNRKRKSRWNYSNVKEEPSEHKFVQQVHEGERKRERDLV